MNVGELKALLAGYADETELVANIDQRGGMPRANMRDIVDQRTHELRGTVLEIQEYPRIGLPHLTPQEERRQRREILESLSGSTWSSGRARFTLMYGDHRIFYDHGGSQDGCYGTSYDPRVFDRLESDGHLRRMSLPGYGDSHTFEVTTAGKAALALMDGKVLLPI